MSLPTFDIVIIGRNEAGLLTEGIASCQAAARECEEVGYRAGKIVVL